MQARPEVSTSSGNNVTGRGAGLLYKVWSISPARDFLAQKGVYVGGGIFNVFCGWGGALLLGTRVPKRRVSRCVAVVKNLGGNTPTSSISGT